MCVTACVVVLVVSGVVGSSSSASCLWLGSQCSRVLGSSVVLVLLVNGVSEALVGPLRLWKHQVLPSSTRAESWLCK